jgi:uncharacterized protein (UPF0216 family)
VYNSKGTLERTFDAILAREIRNLNTHLPKQRRTLTDLLKTKDPTIEAMDGSSILLKTSELDALAKEVPTEYHDRLKLPILILRRMELGRSVYTVSGDRIEEFTVQKLLGRVQEDYHQMHSNHEQVFLYRPEVGELLRMYHSLFVIGFGIPRQLTDYGPKRD